MNIHNLLAEFGLGESESIIYVQSLRMGCFTVREIAEITKLKRPLIYHILQSLGKKGLISTCSKGKIEKFKAEPPEQLLTILAREKYHIKTLEEKTKEALQHFPEKESYIHGIPNISYHRGMTGIKNLIEKIYDSKEKILYSIMPSFKIIEAHLDESYFDYYLEERINRNIQTKSIWQDLPSNKKFLNHAKFLREVRLATKNLAGNFNSMIDIFDNYVIISTIHPELFGLSVESYDFNQTMRALWGYVWKESKPLSQYKRTLL
jgi:sugar-specific transcriptional regulator TrmB